MPVFGAGPSGQGPFGATPEVAVDLVGLEATAELGTLSESLSKDVTLSGLACTAELGILGEQVDDTVTLAGLEATAQLGTLGEQVSTTVPLQGFEAAAQLGAFFVFTENNFLSGFQAQAQLGVLHAFVKPARVFSTTSNRAGMRATTSNRRVITPGTEIL